MVEIKPTLEIGDKVRIVNDGSIYSNYVTMVKAMVEYYLLDKEIVDCWWKSGLAQDGDEGYVIATAKHEDGDTYLALITVDDGYVLMALDGLELIKRRNEIEKLYKLQDIVKYPYGTKFENIETGTTYIMLQELRILGSDGRYDYPAITSRSFEEEYRIIKD